MTTLLFWNTLTFLLLMLIWSTKSWVNMAFKFGFLCLGLGNGLAWLLAMGFVVQS